jgi:hypothetical protein
VKASQAEIGHKHIGNIVTRLQVEVSVWRIAAVGSWLLRDNRLGMNFANGTLLSHSP